MLLGRPELHPQQLGSAMGFVRFCVLVEKLTWHTWAGVADEYLDYVLGRATSTDRSNFNMDADPVFQRNMAVLKASRAQMRYAYLLENGNATREDMRNFTRLKVCRWILLVAA